VSVLQLRAKSKRGTALGFHLFLLYVKRITPIPGKRDAPGFQSKLTIADFGHPFQFLLPVAK
jgi:hypothetical protein